MANTFAALLAAGLLSFLGAVVTAMGSRSRYEDATPVFLFWLAIVLVVVGGSGLLIVRMT